MQVRASTEPRPNHWDQLCLRGHLKSCGQNQSGMTNLWKTWSSFKSSFVVVIVITIFTFNEGFSLFDAETISVQHRNLEQTS